jgi:hypothetical protein
MKSNREIFMIMRENQFNAMDANDRDNLLYIEFREENEYQNNKDDVNYLSLKKAEKKGKETIEACLESIKKGERIATQVQELKLKNKLKTL